VARSWRWCGLVLRLASSRAHLGRSPWLSPCDGHRRRILCLGLLIQAWFVPRALAIACYSLHSMFLTRILTPRPNPRVCANLQKALCGRTPEVTTRRGRLDSEPPLITQGDSWSTARRPCWDLVRAPAGSRAPSRPICHRATYRWLGRGIHPPTTLLSSVF